MKKILRILTVTAIPAALLLLAACKQFLADPEEFFGYWTSEILVTESIIYEPVKPIGGVLCVSSAEDVRVTVKLKNPKNIRLVMPASSSDAKKIILFSGLSTQPVYGTDYTLKQTANDKLELMYKSEFLKRHEWGKDSIAAEITLIAEDGRKFGKKFSFNLKVNTVPPKPVFKLAKTVSNPSYYVLCLTVPDMDKKAAEGLVHKDLTRIEANGTSYTFSVNEAEKRFNKPEGEAFITLSDVEKLTEPDADEVPSGGWVLYYKTDAEVKDGAAKKDYTVKLFDAGGLVSEPLSASTKPNKAEEEVILITKGTKIRGSGSESDPVVIGSDSAGAGLSISSATPNTTVHCTVSEGGSVPVRYDGNPVTVPLGLKGAGEKNYKLEYYTDGTGFAATAVKTVYYKVLSGTAYTVEHYQEKPDGAGQYPSSPYETDRLYGATGAAVSVTHKTYQGFEFEKQEPSSAAIAADGSTVVKVYYKRKTVNLTFNLSGGNVSGNTSDVTVSGRFGTAFTAPAPVKTGYTLSGWTPGLPSPQVFPANNEAYTAQWTENNYTVTFSVEGEQGGSLKGVYNGTDQTASGNDTQTFTVPHGGSVNFTAEPDYAWEVEQWSKDNVAVNETNTSYTLTVTSAAAVMVKFKKKTTVKSTDSNPWKLLKEVVRIADDNAVITIDRTIKATTGTGDNGEIVINKNLIIKGKNDSGTDILNANKEEGGKHKHRIFKVEAGKTLTLQKLKLTGGIAEGTGDAGNGGGILVNGGTVNITNCIITDNKAKEGSGGAISASGAAVTITNCTLTSNEVKIDGGAVFATKDSGGAASTVTISGGIIGTNKVTEEWGSGGGILVAEGCTLILNEYIDGSGAEHGVQISGNEAGRAGGVRANDSTVTMTGCTISGNKAVGDSGGGGVYITGSTLTMTRCTLTGNTTAKKDGGGMNIEKGNATLTSCTITGNTAKENGGGIYVKELDGTASTVTISGGSIGTNTVIESRGSGGGIYIDNGCTVTLQNDSDGKGVEFTGNTAGTSGSGGGVYVGGSNARFSMQGSSKIDVNDVNNDIYLKNGARITVDGSLTGSSPIGRITPENYTAGTQVLAADTGIILAKETYKFRVTSQTSPSTDWTVDEQGKLKQSKYTEVSYTNFDDYLQNLSETETNYVEITGSIPQSGFHSSGYGWQSTGELNEKIKAVKPQKIALKLFENLAGITTMEGCFSGCDNLVSVENIPAGVNNMAACFFECTSLTTVSNIPSTVKNMNDCFYGCTSLAQAPAIPANVENMHACFTQCNNLVQAPDIPPSVNDLSECFAGCSKLEGVKINRSYNGCNFSTMFNECGVLKSGGIKVPSDQLQTYRDNASNMGTTEEKFASQ